MLKKIICSALLLISGLGFAQQDPQYTQYMYNMLQVNPAYAGNRGTISAFGLYRMQWVGLDGAPNTGIFSVHTPVGKTKLGLGVSFSNDRIGIIDESNIELNASYTIDLNDNGSKLSFGLKGVFNILNVEYSRLKVKDVNDPYFIENISGQFSPNIGAGIYWHTDKTYVGFSVPHFLQTNRFEEEGVYSAMNVRNHYYLTAGHVFTLNPMLKLKPAVLIKAVEGAPLQTDLSANFMIQDKLTLGAAWRWDAAWSAMAGYQVNESLFIGYGYDYNASGFHKYNSGSHELFVRYELFKKFRRINSPRFF